MLRGGGPLCYGGRGLHLNIFLMNFIDHGWWSKQENYFDQDKAVCL